MLLRTKAALMIALTGAACTDLPGGGTGGGFIGQLPEGVVDIAAPGQNLNQVRLLPEDGCYWYLHRGPVESTLLPLRTRTGAPICTQAQTTAANASS
ncbi:hypothetical protein [uncultured Tateyamaria sp.]|uniref:hypothetical protein n=1 Tax=uncultured Tateyamaria sp. TaxID=455651 RepID=UPI002610FD9B|nr:hypothetical protein [uncultured Tateyamaria sp.]